MVYPIWLEVVCSVCARSASGRFTYLARLPLRDIQNKAQAEGFIFKYREVFCSKDCLLLAL